MQTNETTVVLVGPDGRMYEFPAALAEAHRVGTERRARLEQALQARWSTGDPALAQLVAALGLAVPPDVEGQGWDFRVSMLLAALASSAGLGTVACGPTTVQVATDTETTQFESHPEQPGTEAPRTRQRTPTEPILLAGGTGGGESSEATRSAWQEVPAPALGDGPVRAVTVGRSLMLVGGGEVQRFDPDLRRFVQEPEARTLAGAVLVRNAGTGKVVGWSPSGGVLYDTATRATTPMSRANAPAAAVEPLGEWVQSSLLVWSGGSAVGRPHAGSLYHPAQDQWVPIPEQNAPRGRVGATGVWTGSWYIVFGGLGAGDVPLNDGGQFSPSVNSWAQVPQEGAPSPRSGHAAAWTGSEMIVWGGAGDAGELGDGAAYDPLRRAWRPISAVDAPAPRRDHIAVWADGRLIVWGGTSQGVARTDGGVYDPATDRWTRFDIGSAAAGRTGATAVWTGRELVVAGGTVDGRPATTVAVWAPDRLP